MQLDSRIGLLCENLIILDLFPDWIADYPESLSHFCDLTSYDLPWAPLPEFAGFCDHSKGVEGLVIERRVKLGTLKSDCTGEKGASVGSFRSGL